MKKMFLSFVFMFLALGLFATERYWVPEPVVLGDHRVQFGYNEPGEMGADARDLRIIDKNNNLITGLVGRVLFVGEDEKNSYATPSNFPVYVSGTEGETVWEWEWTDNRCGIYQKNKAVITKDNVTVYLGVKFLKDIKGCLRFQCLSPNDQGLFINSNNKVKYAEYFIDGKKYVFTCQGRGDWDFRKGHTGFNHTVRRIAYYENLGDRGISEYKAGDEKTFVLNINLNGEKVFPKYEETVFDSKFGMVHSDMKDGKAYIPLIPETLAFLPKEDKKISVSVFNFGKGKENYKVTVSVKDYNNKTVLRKTENIRLASGEEGFAVFDVSELGYGLYSAAFTCKDKEIYRRFDIMRDPIKIDAKDSMFGLQSFMFNNNDSDLDLVSKLGCHFLRIGHNGVWDGSAREKTYENYRLHNIDYCFTLSRNDYDTVDTENLGSGIYEIFNEPDGEMRGPEYIENYKKFYDKIKASRPNARIMGPNVSGGDCDSGFPPSKAFAESDCDFDYLCIHPYSCARVVGEGLEPFSPERNSLYEKLTAASDFSPKPIIMGEYGFTMLCQYRFPDENFGEYEKQFAHYMARSFLIAKLVPKVEKIVHFFLSPEKLGQPTEAPCQYGPYNMLGAENNPEPMFASYATLAYSMDGSVLKQKIEFENAPDVWGLVTERDGEYFLALWTAKGKYKLYCDKLKNCIHRSFVGSDENYSRDYINITEEPFYIITEDYAQIEKILKGSVKKVAQKNKKDNQNYKDLDITWHCKKNSKPIVVDGDLSEWDDFPIQLNEQKDIMPPDPGFWKGPSDLSAKISSKYDDEYFYVACEVTDDYHKNTSDAPALWQEDSLQITLANVFSPYFNVEMNVGISDKTPAIVIPIVGSTKPLANHKCAIKRVGDKTVYEFALAFSDFPDISMGGGEYCRFALCINDKDELGVRRWTGVKDPNFIAGIKEPNNYPVVRFE
ncbi:MAG: hypothetical protein KBT47_03975 [Armatimonadetes bacterium]|nr:hypothetical protein [Candidatus Hippobium faecium]